MTESTPTHLILIDRPELCLQTGLTLKFRSACQRRVQIEKSIQIFKKKRSVDPKLVSDVDFVHRLVQIDGLMLKKTKVQDRRIALAASMQHGNCFNYLKKEFKQDVEILLAVASTCTTKVATSMLVEAHDIVNSEILETLLGNEKVDSFLIFRSIPVRYLQDKEFVLKLIPKLNYCLYPAVFLQFLSDRDSLLEILRSSRSINGNLIGHLPSTLLCDKEFIIAILSRNGLSIEKIPRNLQADRDVIHAAVKNDGRALMFAHPPHNSDREIVLDAIRNNPRAFYYVDKTLSDSTSFVKLCAATNPDGFLELGRYDILIKRQFSCAGAEFSDK